MTGRPILLALWNRGGGFTTVVAILEFREVTALVTDAEGSLFLTHLDTLRLVHPLVDEAGGARPVCDCGNRHAPGEVCPLLPVLEGEARPTPRRGR
jgi:hypothetical protein